MNPADILKLSITFSNDVHIDVVVALSWVHQSVAFQHISDAVMFIMADVGVKIFAYIDDYIIVSLRVFADTHF